MNLADYLNDMNGQHSRAGQLPRGLITAEERLALMDDDFNRLCRVFEALCACPDGNTTVEWVICEAIKPVKKSIGMARAHEINTASINQSLGTYLAILERWKNDLSKLTEAA